MNELVNEEKKNKVQVSEKRSKIPVFIYEKSDGHIFEYSFLFSLNQTHFRLQTQVYHFSGLSII